VIEENADMVDQANTAEPVEINVVEIMEQIREKIREKRGSAFLLQSGPDVKRSDSLDNTVLYESLEEANIWHDKIYVDDQLLVPRTALAKVLLRLRKPMHELVRFYVNRMCDKQVIVNMHLIKATGALATEVRRNNDRATEIRRLGEEVQALRQQVEELKKCLEKS
jgi:hypothetical protein